MEWNKIPDDKTIETAAIALRARGFEVIIVGNREEAKSKTLEYIPKGAEVMTMTSETLKDTGITAELEGGEYNSLRKQITGVDRKEMRDQMRKKTLGPDYAIGSVHAITEDGQVLIASASGSQLPAYAYGANNVVWVVGAQKIVKSLDDGLKRINEYSLVLESERVKKAYGMPHSVVNKILIYEGEQPGRIHIVIVKENLGF